MSETTVAPMYVNSHLLMRDNGSGCFRKTIKSPDDASTYCYSGGILKAGWTSNIDLNIAEYVPHAPISDHQQSMAPAPSRGLPHATSWWSLI